MSYQNSKSADENANHVLSKSAEFVHFFLHRILNLETIFHEWNFLKKNIWNICTLFSKNMSFFSWFPRFGKRYERNLRVIFHRWPMLCAEFVVDLIWNVHSNLKRTLSCKPYFRKYSKTTLTSSKVIPQRILLFNLAVLKSSPNLLNLRVVFHTLIGKFYFFLI